MYKSLKLALLFLFILGLSLPTQAQFLKKLKNKIEKATTVKTQADKNSSGVKDEVETIANLNEWHTSHAGQVVFYNKFLEPTSSSSDSQSGVVTEAVLASKSPLYFRAYLGKKFNASCTTCDNIEIRYTMGGQSITTQDLRVDLPQYYVRMASVKSFYDHNNYTVGVALNSAPAKYMQDYTLQEDAYRILLSKIEDKIKKGATLILKVEIMAMNKKVADPTVLASGEIPLKVTDESYDLQNLNCRCGREGMTDATQKKEALDAFRFQFNDFDEVYKVVLNGRDFTQVYDDSYAKNVLGKGMDANFIYKSNEGIYMQTKFFIFHKKDGNSFSDKITIGKNVYYIPVSPTCAK